MNWSLPHAQDPTVWVSKPGGCLSRTANMWLCGIYALVEYLLQLFCKIEIVLKEFPMNYHFTLRLMPPSTVMREATLFS